MKISTALISGLLLPLCLGTVGCQTPGLEGGGGQGWWFRASAPGVSVEFGVGPAPAKVTAPQGGAIKQQGDTKTQTNAPVSVNGELNGEGSLIAGTVEGDDGQTYSGTASLIADENGEYTAWVEA